jgi:hypothetical protein
MDKVFEQVYKSFFEYFLGTHAVQCDNKECVCRASTFVDIICEPRLRKSKRYGSTIEEVLSMDDME